MEDEPNTNNEEEQRAQTTMQRKRYYGQKEMIYKLADVLVTKWVAMALFDAKNT